MRKRAGSEAHRLPRGRLAGPLHLERSILRSLCNTALTLQVWNEVTRALNEYRWVDVEHGLVYAAIRRFRCPGPRILREQLAAEATRMGFPDIDWHTYFSTRGQHSAARSANQILGQVKRLVRPPRAAASSNHAVPGRGSA